jgi:UDP-N-acetylmuramoyl-L-alanyl-D-glutamate--2,6-diaminopimelate ligase
MGEIAGRLADYCILTSDNPRNEGPHGFLAEIEEGIRPTGCEYIVIENRRAAIRTRLKWRKRAMWSCWRERDTRTYQESRGLNIL